MRLRILTFFLYALAAYAQPRQENRNIKPYMGNGPRIILYGSTTAPTSGNCIEADANGNLVDAGAPCATGSSVWGQITGTLSDQTDLNAALAAKQPLDSDLTTIAGLSCTAGQLMHIAGGNWACVDPSVAAGVSWGAISGTLSNQTDLQNALDALQPLDAALTDISGLSCSSGEVIEWDGSNFVCGAGVGGSTVYAATLGSSTTWTVTGVTHGLDTCDLTFGIYSEAAGVRSSLVPSAFTCDTANYDVVITFTVAQAGRLVLLKSGGGSGSSGTTYYQTMQVDGVGQTQRSKLNLIAGANCTLTPADDAGNDRTNVTITCAGGGGGTYTGGTGISIAGSTISIDSTTVAPIPTTTTFSHDFGNIANGACAQTTGALTGVALGDSLIASVSTVFPSGVNVMLPKATGVGTFALELCNFSGSSYDPANSTYRVTKIVLTW